MTASTVNTDVLERLRALGDGPAVVLVVHPTDLWTESQWQHQLLRALAPEWSTRVEAMLLGMLRMSGIEPVPVELSGWDHARPTLIGLADSGTMGPPGASAVAMALDAKAVRLRSEAWLPATDVRALMDALTQMVGPAGQPISGSLVDDPDARVLSIEHGVVAILPEDGAVRLVVVSSAIARDVDDDAAAYRADLGPRPEPARLTPALRMIASEDVRFGSLVRPDRLAAQFAVYGMFSATRAIDTVSMDQRTAALAVGTQIVLDAELLVGQSEAEVDQWAVVVHGDGKDPTTELLAFHDASEGVSSREEERAVRPLVLATNPMVELLLPRAPGAARGSSLSAEHREALEGCGFSCRFPLLLRAPRAEAPTILPKPLDTALRPLWDGPYEALQVAASLDERGRPQVAVAIVVPDVDQARALRASLEPSFSMGWSPEIVTIENRAVLLLGWGVDPRAVFRMRFSPDTTTEARLSFNPSRLASAGSVPIREVSGRFVDTPEAWRGWLVTGSDEAEHPPLAIDGSDAAGPSRAAERCFVEAGWALRGGLRVLRSSASVESIATAFEDAVAAASPHLECAADDPSTAAAAAALHRMVTTLVVRRLEELYGGERTLALVEARCSASGDEGVCELAEGLRGRPQPRLAEVKTEPDCDEGPIPGVLGIPLAVVDGRLVVQGHVLENVAGLREALEEAGVDRNAVFGLAVDDRSTAGDVLPVLDVLRRRGSPGVWIVGQQDGSAVSVPATLGAVRGSTVKVQRRWSWEEMIERVTKECEVGLVW